MPIKVDVHGIGVLEFPDDYTDDQIEAAIKEHPLYEKVTSGEIKPPVNYADMSTGDIIGAGVKTFARGIPVLGDFIDETEETKALQKEHPIISALVKGAGTLSTAALPFGGAAVATGSRLIPFLMGQSGIGAILGGAENLSGKLSKDEKVDPIELLRDISFGAAGGALGGGAGRLASLGLTKPTVGKTLKSAAKFGVGGAFMGFDPITSTLAGAAGRHLATNRFFRKPTAQGILSALGQQGAGKVEDTYFP